MEFLSDFFTRFVDQLRSPTIGFLIAGMVLAAFNSQLQIPDAVYKFIVFMLLIKVGLSGGIAIRDADLAQMLLPAAFAAITGILIVLIARNTLARLPGVQAVDAIATGGLFGAVSGSTMAAGITLMEEIPFEFEDWAGALYPFMDIPALVTAIVIASIYTSKQKALSKARGLGKEEYLSKQPVAAGDHPGEQRIVASGYPSTESEYRSQQGQPVKVWPIVKDSLQGYALSALLVGLALGLLTKPDSVYENFFNPPFRGLLSVLMLIMGMEAWSRINELRSVAQWYVVYAIFSPLLHGLIGFGFGYIAHVTTGFSPGGVVLLSVIAASSSDISGPPTLRGGIPSANPSAYIGASTAIGTPIAIAVCIPFFIGLAQAVMPGS